MTNQQSFFDTWTSIWQYIGLNVRTYWFEWSSRQWLNIELTKSNIAFITTNSVYRYKEKLYQVQKVLLYYDLFIAVSIMIYPAICEISYIQSGVKRHSLLARGQKSRQPNETKTEAKSGSRKSLCAVKQKKSRFFHFLSLFSPGLFCQNFL